MYYIYKHSNFANEIVRQREMHKKINSRLKLLLYTIPCICGMLVFFCACERYKVDEVMQLAGENRHELEKVLFHYAKENPSSEKLEAAKFLISNMKWHKSVIVPEPTRKANLFLDSLISQADSILYEIHDNSNTKGKIELAKAQADFCRKNLELFRLYSPEGGYKERYDYEHLTAKQIIDHIDFSFTLKKSSPYLKDINREDFYEYVLPYRPCPELPIVDFPQSYFELFHKYMKDVPTDSIQQLADTYYSVIKKLRGFFLLFPCNNELIGYRELLHNTEGGCFELTNYAVSAMRVCGLPTATEFNIGYKQLRGKHFRCVIANSRKEWQRWTLTTTQMIKEGENFMHDSGCMNLYRYTYSAQKDTPYFLHGTGEYIPDELSSPCIKDVTDEVIPTLSLSLPFKAECDNKVAYLASFNSGEHTGMRAVTWGTIRNGKATFHHVIPERIYFLVYYEPTGTPKVVGTPFYVNSSGKMKEFLADSTTRVRTVIHRKFPQKPSLVERSKTLTGAVITASNDENFAEADTVGTISHLPIGLFQDVTLTTGEKPYQYYRIQTKENIPLHLAEAELLTRANYGYKEVSAATPLPCLSYKDTTSTVSGLVRLKECPSSEPQAAKDGNPLTVELRSVLQFTFNRPYRATHLRFLPINADNHITPEYIYELRHWSNGEWVTHKTDTAKYHFLEYDLYPEELYWLKCLSGGKEESPFTIDKDGNVEFIY